MKKTSVILGLMLTIISALIVGVSFSAAYFIADTDLYVQDFDISLVGNPTIELGVKDNEGNIKFADSLSADDIGTIPMFIPVSSMYEGNWRNDTVTSVEKPTFKETYRTGKISSEATYRETKDATEGFLTKEIYLKASQDCYAMVSEESSFSPNTAKNEEIANSLVDTFPNLSHDEIVKNLNTTYKSLRYSFLYNDKDYLIYDPYKVEDTIFAGPLDINSDGYYDYYRKDDSYYEFLYGEYLNSDKLLYGTNKFNSDGELPETTTFSAKTRGNVNHIDLSRSVLNGLVVAKENSLSSSALKTKRHLFLLKKGEPYRVVLSIYLEGWDLDNTSLAMYGSFNANLTFSLTEETIYV